MNHNCSICDVEIEEENGDIIGNFGILPVAFCVWCYSGLTDMVFKLNGLDQVDVLEEMINEIKENN